MANRKTIFCVLKRTRRKPEAGDIFTFELESHPGTFYFGRVVATDTKLGNFDDAVLIYIYRATSNDKTAIPILNASELLVPPIGTNNLAWTRGYFEVVASGANGPNDLLPQHCFLDPIRKEFVDENGNHLACAVEPVGFYGLSGLGSIENKVISALGFSIEGLGVE